MNPQITCAEGVQATPEEVRQSHVFRQWLERLATDGPSIELRAVTVLAVHAWGRPTPEIKMLHLLVEAYEGERRLDGVCTLRGATVDMLALLDDGSSEEHVVFVIQPRVPGAQSAVVSNPSGMVDPGEQVKLAGLRELDEELANAAPDGEETDGDGIIVWGEPIDLGEYAVGSDEPFLVSPGGSDETVKFFVVRARVTSAQIRKLHNKFGGAAHEDERVQIIVVPLSQARTAAKRGGKVCLKTLLSLLLYKEYSVG
ncbi:MAG TPA: hypothetical protein VJM32_04190 [Candidatus Saccharimonadales bacterium]|nr:hypothetical protein [Candidatus Saccharimonadales bacterium]